MSTTAHASRVGVTVGGKYRLTRLLAEGGMGVVYEAQHVVVRRRFAIKFLRADLVQRREILARFHREAQAAGELESENIASALDFGILPDGTPYIVMEYLVGESLRSLLNREGPLPIGRGADLCAQAARGIAIAHASGIVHRDLKPDNLFVCRRDDGTDLVKILDFGIAKLEQLVRNDAVTRTGAILGTPAYMSPEQARGDTNIDHRTDIYSLAAVLFELLSGKNPHPGDSQNAILHHICTQPAVSLASMVAQVPPPLVETIQRALSSDPEHRHPSADAFGRTLNPFATSQIWPVVTGEPATLSASTLRHEAAASERPQAHSRRRRLSRTVAVAVAAAGLVTAALAVTWRSGTRVRFSSTPVKERERGTFAKDARFYVPVPMPGAVQQIAELVKRGAFTDVAPLTALAATAQGIWFSGGSPEDVRSAVQNVVVRAAPDRRVPILVANNIPFRDCAQYSAGGANDTAAYREWIDGFASGIGNARAVVILEPDSLGIIPYSTEWNGTDHWCRPTVTDADRRTIAAPGASASERYVQLNHAVDTIAVRAPNASVYLDGTHPGWLGAGEVARRLCKAGVARAQGFFVNVSNFQPTSASIQYGTWISKCIFYADQVPDGDARASRYHACGSQYSPATVDDYATWHLTDAWYANNVDPAITAVARRSALTHFIVDTSRNGRGRLNPARFAAAPYGQPKEVIKGLTTGEWCNPPDAGLGSPPTADTGVPLVDAFLWVKVPGSSDGSCDIAGGGRAWDYRRYNPWGITGDAQKHFDPLWGMVDPGAGEWFADQALQLAHNAVPPLPSAVPEAQAIGPSTASVAR